MHIIDSAASLAVILNTADPPLQRLLHSREQALFGDSDTPFGGGRFVIAYRTDPLATVTQALGFSPVHGFIDGQPWHHADFTPAFEWGERHERWFELCFVLTDDGFAHILLVEDDEQTDPDLIGLCRQELGQALDRKPLATPASVQERSI